MTWLAKAGKLVGSPSTALACREVDVFAFSYQLNKSSSKLKAVTWLLLSFPFVWWVTRTRLKKTCFNWYQCSTTQVGFEILQDTTHRKVNKLLLASTIEQWNSSKSLFTLLSATIRCSVWGYLRAALLNTRFTIEYLSVSCWVVL